MGPREIRELREGFGLSMATFAHLCGVSTSTVYRWEEVGRVPNPDPLQRAIMVLLERLAKRWGAKTRKRFGDRVTAAALADGPLAGIALLHAAGGR